MNKNSFLHSYICKYTKGTPFGVPQTVDKVSKEALFFLAKNAEIWYNKVKKNK